MYILPTLKLIFVQAVLNTVVYQILIVYTNVLVTVINPCGYWASGTSSALASNGNTLYNVIGVPVDLPESESISGAEINGTVCAANSGVLCWNLAENCSKSVLKMCIS